MVRERDVITEMDRAAAVEYLLKIGEYDSVDDAERLVPIGMQLFPEEHRLTVWTYDEGAYLLVWAEFTPKDVHYLCWVPEAEYIEGIVEGLED